MATTDARPINFQLYYRDIPGEQYREGDPMQPAGGVIQYPGVRLRLDTCAGVRETLDMIFEFGNGSGIELLPRALSVGDVICVWLNPYGERKYFAVDDHSYRPVSAKPFEALLRAEILRASKALFGKDVAQVWFCPHCGCAAHLAGGPI